VEVPFWKDLSLNTFWQPYYLSIYNSYITFKFQDALENLFCQLRFLAGFEKTFGALKFKRLLRDYILGAGIYLKLLIKFFVSLIINVVDKLLPEYVQFCCFCSNLLHWSYPACYNLRDMAAFFNDNSKALKHQSKIVVISIRIDINKDMTRVFLPT
jgi:hypothetical protein